MPVERAWPLASPWATRNRPFYRVSSSSRKKDGSYYSNSELSEAVLLVAFASVHTTSMQLGFCLYWLIARPDIRDQLLHEIQSIEENPITTESLDKLTLLDNFVREVLRRIRQAHRFKKALKGFTFANGYQVPKGKQGSNSPYNLKISQKYRSISRVH